MSMEFRPFARILHDIERTRPVGLDADMRLKGRPEKAAARMKRFPDIDAVARRCPGKAESWQLLQLDRIGLH